MNEVEWLVTENTFDLYWWVWNRASFKGSYPPVTRRAGSLYAVACVRATPQAVSQEFLTQAAAVVERAADDGNWALVDALNGQANRRCSEAFAAAGQDSAPHAWALAAFRLTQNNIDQYAMHVPLFMGQALEGADNLPALRKTYADVLRDIFGNPYHGGRGFQFNKRKRKPQPEPLFRAEWRTDTVMALARTMYERRDFSGMPILADALQEAGCEQPHILAHCRDLRATHVRGCWVVDLVLGKS